MVIAKTPAKKIVPKVGVATPEKVRKPIKPLSNKVRSVDLTLKKISKKRQTSW